MNRFLRHRAMTNRRPRIYAAITVFLLTFTGLGIAPAFAQAPLPTPPVPSPTAQPAPSFPAAELDRIVSPIALYPDPLLAQVLAATTFSMDIPEAARWADEHHYLTGTQLTAAMAADRLPWDPSVQALLPFPSVLDMMASAVPWTQELGDAVLAQRADVMDAVQRMRQKAQSYGYLRSTPQVTVSQGPYVEIQPVDPGFIVVPYLRPLHRLRTAAARLRHRPGPSGSGLACGSARGSGRGAGDPVTSSGGPKCAPQRNWNCCDC